MTTTGTEIAESSLDADRLVGWVIEQGLQGTSTNAVFQEFCERMVAGGVPILRGFAAMTTLHPLYTGFGLVWARADAEVRQENYDDNTLDPEAWARSPLKALVDDGLPELRRRITGPKAGQEFPILEDFRAEGATDYYALTCGFAQDGHNEEKRGIVFSWTTDRAEGFGDADLALIRRLMPPLALTMRVAANRRIAAGVATAYLGRDAGQRVLNGEIKRGAVQTISAVLLYADLRGFTTLSDTMPKDEIVGMLNDYLACMAEPVEERDGQVLKFMGDGMLSIFAISADQSAAQRGAMCVAALEAALDALGRVAALNRERAARDKPTMPLDMALHLGDVLYGNVGSPSRLDFTMIGPAVNEASRMEAMCGPLERSLLISRAFAEAMPPDSPDLIALGRHGLRGVREPVHLFTVEDPPA